MAPLPGYITHRYRPDHVAEAFQAFDASATGTRVLRIGD
jgi:hypothetical protein